ncbi:MAG: hypothetical protein QM784_05155 [Polyangiaceae bacterium]
MAHDKSPLRLVEDPDTTGPLRMLIEQAQQDLPDAARLRAFSARLDVTLAKQATPVDPPPDAPIAPREVGRKLSLGKLSLIGLGLVIGGVVVSVIGFARRDDEASAVASGIVSAAHDEAAPSASPVTPQPPPATAASDSTTAQTNVERATAPTPTTASADSRARTEPIRPPPSEAALLLEARSALGQDAARALRITQEHARLYPSGILAQEREVIAIEALRRLGKTDLAKKRSAAFDKRYPGSVHRSKIKQTLESP